MGFTGPGIACDYLDIEGPIHDAWPPRDAQPKPLYLRAPDAQPQDTAHLPRR